MVSLFKNAVKMAVGSVAKSANLTKSLQMN